MHKFDSLSELKIAIIDYESSEASSLSEFRSDDSLRRFFQYLTRISKYLVTGVLINNSLLRQALIDLKKYFQIKHLTLSNIVPACEGTKFSIKSLSRARDGHRRQVLLDLEIGTAELLSVARLVCEVLSEDVVKLQFGNGKAVQLGINLLPLLKTLTAVNPGIHSMKSIVRPKAPKLTLDLLELGNFTRLDALLEMSQRIQHIERWVAPHLQDYDEQMKRQNCVLNMPFTTFGEIHIDSIRVSRFIVKLSTSSNTTFHGVGSSSADKPLTEDDYYRQDDEEESLSEEDDFENGSMDNIGKVRIICADVKTLILGSTTIQIED